MNASTSGISSAANPIRLQGMGFVEFAANEPATVEAVLRQLGFVQTRRHRSMALALWEQGEICFLLNSQPGTHGYEFARVHGPSICAIAFLAENAQWAHETAVRRGAAPYTGQARPAVAAPALAGIGESVLYLVDSAIMEGLRASCDVVNEATHVEGLGLVAIDHLTHNVRAGGLERWVSFYKDVFGFHEFFYLDAQGAATGFRTKALRSPCKGIAIPINEPTDPKSQIQEFIDLYHGEGVQHVALASRSIYDSVEALHRSGVPFMQVLDNYYDQIDERLAGHGEDVERLRRTRVLIDGSRSTETSGWRLLLQIFTKPLVGPIFFEIIQRKGNEGFGDNNARALFEAIEQDQLRRGVIKVR